jgi:hypothetical protein
LIQFCPIQVWRRARRQPIASSGSDEVLNQQAVKRIAVVTQI